MALKSAPGWMVVSAVSLVMGLLVGAAAIVGQTGPKAAEKAEDSTAAPGIPSETAAGESLGLHYARAVRDGDCGEVIALTWWMQERLDFVALEAGTAAARDAEHAVLCARLIHRVFEENVLRPEGVEDQYVFRPGAKFELIGYDEGEDTLAKPVWRREWILVRYTSPAQALRDARGRPLERLRVGVNISEDGYILKAGIVGNLTIDRDSARMNLDAVVKGD